MLLAIQSGNNDCIKAVAECVRGGLFSNASVLQHLEPALLELQEHDLNLFFGLLQSLPLLLVGHLTWTHQWGLEQLLQDPIVIGCVCTAMLPASTICWLAWDVNVLTLHTQASGGPSNDMASRVRSCGPLLN
jgi:hypothetical protein